MARLREKIVVSWSGGKDSVLALQELKRQGSFEVVGLLAVVDAESGAVFKRCVPRELLSSQAEALGIPLTEVVVDPEGGVEAISSAMGKALAPLRELGVHKVGFGDLFHDDIRDFREEWLEALGMEAEFPLWYRNTKELAEQFIHARYRAVVPQIDLRSLDISFLGRSFDRQFLQDLPMDVDHCGENGEFTTFVYDGPIFKKPLAIRVSGDLTDGHLGACHIEKRPGSTRPLLLRIKR